MAGGADAEVTVGADASAVARAAAVAKTAWVDAGNAIKSAIGAAAQSVVTDLGNVALSQGKVNFASQHQQVREFESASAHMAVAMGRDLSSVRSSLESTGAAIGKRPLEVAKWASEVGKLTYNFDGAAEAMKGIAGLAAQTGRSTDDYRGLAAELGTVGKVGGDTTAAIAALTAQANALRTKGGVAAFAGQVEGLEDVISRFGISSTAEFLKVTAAAGALTAGLNDVTARRVQQSTFGTIANNPLGWGRFLGRDLTNAQGQVEHPEKVMEEIAERFKRQYGQRGAKEALQYNFGTEGGAAIFTRYLTKEGREAGAKAAAAAGTSAATQGPALGELLGTDAGKRDVAGSKADVAARDLMGSASLLGGAADALQRWASTNPITTTVVATALGTGASSFMSSFGKSISTMMGGGGEGGAAGGAVDLVTKGKGGKDLLKYAGFLGLAAAGEKVAENAVLDTRASTWQKSLGVGKALDLGGMSAGDMLELARDPQKLGKFLADQASASQGGGASGGGGLSDDAVAKLRAAFSDGIKIEVSNASDTPITATVKGGHSSAAGSQKT